MVTDVESPSRTWVWWTFRVLVTALTVDTYLQAVLAGRFLSGDYPMLAAHELNGTKVVAITSFVVVAWSIIAWRMRLTPGVLVVMAVALSGVIVLQIFMGFQRVLGVHIPLGVTIIVLTTALAVWVWRRAA
jgi:hypothetical protein